MRLSRSHPPRGLSPRSRGQLAWQPKLDRPRLLAHRAPWRLSADALQTPGPCLGTGLAVGCQRHQSRGTGRPEPPKPIPVRPLRRASSGGEIWGRCSASRTTITASTPRAMAPQGDVSSLLAATACGNGLQQQLVLQRIHGSPRRGVASREHNKSLAPAGRTPSADGVVSQE